MRQLRNIFACLVHESEECILDLVRNLRALDPASPVLLYNGSQNRDLLNHGLPFARYGAEQHPSPRPLSWGRLHDFALDCIEYALANHEFDTLTIVDSDQLGTRPGYSEYLARFLGGEPRVGMLGNCPGVQPTCTRVGPAIAAYQEIELWRPFLRRFPDGENNFAHWSFWPSTVFTADAARDLLHLFRHDSQLSQILERSRIWASEEVILPTVAALLGYEVASNPCSYDYVRYRVPYALSEVDAALDRLDVFWMHPVPRRYDDPVRMHLRRKLDHYQTVTTKGASMTPNTPSETPLFLVWPILQRMRGIEGWLADEEADLLISACARAVTSVPSARAVVEVGSYCGRSTVVLGSVIQSLPASDVKVYAIDPHDGIVGALDQHVQQMPPTLSKFQHNVEAAGLTSVVQPIQSLPFEVRWDQPICFLFIDALHDYMNVARDFYHFEAFVVQGGYVAFHDYAPYYPGVMAFVDELLTVESYERVGCAASLIVLRKTANSDRPQATPASVAGVQPMVSCIMPTANRHAFVPQAIRCFLRQDYSNRELIILDDGSDPVGHLVPDDTRIRYIRMDERRTIGAKHNLGCQLAHGEIVAHWDDDDWNASWRLTYQISELLKCPPMTLVGFAKLLFYSPGDGRAWEYVYPAGQRPWVSGTSFCYRKELWSHHPFPDMNEGDDTTFVWGLTDVRVIALPNHRCLVAMVHANNTSPKQTGGPAWHALPGEEVRRLLVEDQAFYATIARDAGTRTGDVLSRGNAQKHRQPTQA